MSRQERSLQVGDSVRVKEGTRDPDFGTDLSGWQGRISELPDDEDPEAVVCIDWDSITLQQMPGEMIVRCEEEGLSWSEMYLRADEVERVAARDTPAAVERTIRTLEQQYGWAYLGEQGQRIQQILTSADPDDELDALAAWEGYLEEHLSVPFETILDTSYRGGDLRAGDRLTVISVEMADDHYGIIVGAKKGRQRYDVLLADLTVVDEKSLNYQLVHDYRVWFANR